MMSTRYANRASNQLRPIQIERNYTKHAEGSVLISMGDTRVLCTASVEEGVPSFLKGRGQGWVTAEYGMLPRATHSRTKREAASGKQSGRTQEIQRLIGRALRAAMYLPGLGERQITIDCDVLQADGGTRCAAITGGFIALHDACQRLVQKRLIAQLPIQTFIAAVSVGCHENQILLDLDYTEDSQCETDMNVVMNDRGEFIEIQGTAEGKPFSRQQTNEMLDLAQNGIRELLVRQKEALSR